MNNTLMVNLSHRWPPALRGRWIAAAAAAVALVAVLHLADRPVSVWAVGLPHPVRDFMDWMTRWGESDWILIPALVVLVVAAPVARFVTVDKVRTSARELVALSGFLFLGVGLTSLAAAILKRAIGRGRPETWSLEAPLAFLPNLANCAYQGFPSGHATTAFSFALVLAFVWPRTFWPALVFAVLISLSRVVEGEHYPVDIAAGAMLGIFGAYVARSFFATRGWLFAPGADGSIVRKPFSGLKGLCVRG